MMSAGYKLDQFRGLIEGSARNGQADLALVDGSDGWQLRCCDASLCSAKGDVRSFRTVDAAISYIKREISPYIRGNNISVQVQVRASSLF
ncbi:hypothetical protein ACMHYO_11750 [Allopusillimonas ginsengisoli]|uniref:hypothetical protein n=1 Tax=Allopusillimonas ginsengisoli TaxID=453575 RepID=UPI0039C4E388